MEKQIAEIKRVSTGKLEKMAKKYDDKARKKLNKVGKEIFNLIYLEQMYRKAKICYKCNHLKDTLDENGRLTIDSHQIIHFCSYSIATSCAVRSILDGIIASNKNRNRIDKRVIKIIEKTIEELNQLGEWIG